MKNVLTVFSLCAVLSGCGLQGMQNPAQPKSAHRDLNLPDVIVTHSSCDAEAQFRAGELVQLYGVKILAAVGTQTNVCSVQIAYLDGATPVTLTRIPQASGTYGWQDPWKFTSIAQCEAERAHQLELFHKATGLDAWSAACFLSGTLEDTPAFQIIAAGNTNVEARTAELEVEGLSSAELGTLKTALWQNVVATDAGTPFYASVREDMLSVGFYQDAQHNGAATLTKPEAALDLGIFSKIVFSNSAECNAQMKNIEDVEQAFGSAPVLSKCVPIFGDLVELQSYFYRNAGAGVHAVQENFDDYQICTASLPRLIEGYRNSGHFPLGGFCARLTDFTSYTKYAAVVSLKNAAN